MTPEIIVPQCWGKNVRKKTAKGAKGDEAFALELF